MEYGKKWDLISIASIPLIMTLGNSMLIPILPTIQQELGITSLQASLTITVYSVVAIVLIPLAGYLSDRYGRKRVILPSLIITAVGGLIAGLAAWWLSGMAAYWMLLAGRFLQGIGAAGAAPIVLPLVGDLFYDEEDVSHGLGVVETSNTFGKVISPILGAALALVVWFLPFLMIPVFCTISLLLVLFLVKAPPQDPEDAPTFGDFLQSIRKIFRQKGRWLFAVFLIGGIAMFVVFGVLFYLSSLLEKQYGIDGVIKGMILAIPLLALCLSSYWAGKAIGQNKKLMKWVAFAGCLVVTGSIAAGALLENVYYLLGSLFVGGIGIGVALPCLDAFITEGISKEERGTITSLYSSMRFIGVSAGPPVVSILMAISHRTLFFTISGVCAFAAVLSLFAIRPQETGKPKPVTAQTRPKALRLLTKKKARS